MIVVRLSAQLLTEIRADLGREHPFAAERVGYVYGRCAALPDGGRIAVLSRYCALDDGEYIPDVTVGARISGAAVRRTLDIAHVEKLSAFHVHAHPHAGEPWLSPTDRKYLPGLVRPFRVLVPEESHGAILLSDDRAVALATTGEAGQLRAVDRFVVVGHPMRELVGA